MSEIRTKLYYQDQIRRFTIAKKTDFKAFLAIVGEFYPRLVKEDRVPILKYEDEEKEFVTFSTEIEWQELLKQDFKILRIRLEKKKARVHEKKDSEIPTKPGDYVYELNSKQISGYLRTGEIKLDSPVCGHLNIVCDGCNADSFQGKRYTCQNCYDFDFCEKCFVSKNATHFEGAHQFKVIATPTLPQFSKVVTHIIDDSKKDRKKHKCEERKKCQELKKETKEKKRLEKEVRKVEKVDMKKEKIIEVKVQEKAPEKVINLVPVVQDPIKVVPSAPKLEELKPKEDRDEKFNIHYKILSNMGFNDINKNTDLLRKNAGNLQKVVDELLK
jgi:hypothetical protein